VTDAALRVALDATPLLGRPTGIGRYVAGLAGGLAALPDPPAVTLVAFTFRGARDVPPLGGARVAGRRFPARLLQALWSRTDLPPVEWIAGRADVVHGTNFVLPPARRAAGVLTIHDLAYDRFPETVTPDVLRYRELVPRALRRGAVVVTVSRTVAEEVVERYRLPAERVVVTVNGVDPAFAAADPPGPQERAALGLPERYLLFAGNREPRKGLPALLAGYARLRAADPLVPPLVLAGPAGWGAPVGTAPGVRLAGYLPDQALRRVVSGAAALVFPSRYEGFGLPPLEALACGVPAVVSDLPVLREVLAGHATYVPVGDPEALAAALAAVLGDDGGPAARAARRAHAATFTWARCAAATRGAYEVALG
jgi:glycosyltransferase involved in cell wall biosynthesis